VNTDVLFDTANDHNNVEKEIEAVATTSDETAILSRPCM